ncbi:hypothetical protein [Roseovarius sp. 2305UL8-3]|uniref:hypothetical protein n=1 Tax=Roseovarius conchicola TaxID=3121636 RepID=UPI003529CACB
MARKTTKRVKKAAKQTARPPVSRRDAMTRIAWVGVGGAAVLGVGGAFAIDFRNKMAEGDLTRIGQGVPTIVQIHDPTCSLCRELQRETRAALKQFDDEAVTYLVANIQNIDGADFQAQMGLPNVSLVLFDGDGTRVSYVQGVTPRDELEQTFRRQLKL